MESKTLTEKLVEGEALNSAERLYLIHLVEADEELMIVGLLGSSFASSK
jgi:hypothetical protein